jgi:hypothetical protein
VAVFPLLSAPSFAETLHVANHSFEAPVLVDGAVAVEPPLESQGSHGWVWLNPDPFVSDLGIWNPAEAYYPSADGNGTPAGADGAQVAYLQPNGGEIPDMQQGLAGPDEIFGNDDDPRLLPNRDYILTVSVGRRAPVAGDPTGFAQFGMAWILNPTNDFGGQLLVSYSASADTIPAGAFQDFTFALDHRTIQQPSFYGGRLGIRLFTGRGGDVVVDYDNVRAEVVTIPEPDCLAILTLGMGLFARRSSRRG